MTSATTAIEDSPLLSQPIERNWSTERQLAQSRLDDLRRERGAALLDGGTFDHSAILDAEAALDAIQAAEVEETRRARSQHDEEARRLRANRQRQLRSVLDQRTASMRQAEKATRALAKALSELLQHSEQASVLVRSLGASAWQLQPSIVTTRASYRVAHALGSVTGTRFGDVVMPAAAGPALPDGTSTKDSWADADQKTIAAEVAAVLPQENDE